MCAAVLFPENRIVPLVCAAVLSRTLLHTLVAAERYPLRDIVCVLLIFNKSLGTSSPIDLLLSCVIHRV